LKETSTVSAVSVWLKWLRLLCLSVLIVPTTILASCAVLMTVNSNAGWLKYPLPGIFLPIYVMAGLASPVVGIAALIILWMVGRKFNDESWRKEHRLRIHILVVGMIDILAIAFWVMLFPIVFFNAGGSR